jgi:hypothetical protein
LVNVLEDPEFRASIERAVKIYRTKPTAWLFEKTCLAKGRVAEVLARKELERRGFFKKEN